LILQDFKSVAEYNSAPFKISSKLKLCGENITDEDMLERAFSTFHPTNMLLQQQYRERNFKRYSELISCLLVAEQNNELLLKNHQSCPTGSAPFPEVNRTSFNNRGNNGQRREHGKNNQYRGKRTYNSPRRNTTHYHQKWNHNETQQKKGKGLLNKPPKAHNELCFRCGMEGHWSRTCRTAKHLVDLYQASKGKGKEIETNFAGHSDPKDYMGVDITHLDVYENPNRETI
jgi:hypothetical protein